jgi:DNA processing protein
MRLYDISYILYTDLTYPALLREIPDAPFLLFFRGCGDILCRRSVSVVGTRSLTAEGRKAAFDFAHDAASDGCTVVSGLAFGTDTEVHKGAVAVFLGQMSDSFSEQCGRTAAVLPGGIDEVVPRSNIRLARSILESGGCLCSEYAPGTAAASWRFVQRNRIIAALSPVTVVIQAPPGSGALLTADFALEYGRDVVFHAAALCETAKCLSVQVRRQLEVKIALGEKKRAKLENTIEKYLDDGAPIIEDYADYIRYLSELPGERNCKIKDRQLPLFE